YIAAYTPDSEVMVVDTRTNQVIDRIGTATPVFDVAITNDDEKLFLACGHAGLKVLDFRSRRIRDLSPLICPMFLAMDSTGSRLFIRYQCEGPDGRQGHDSVEIYDVDAEKRIGVVNDLPMVGGRPVASPGEGLLLLDGSDACSSPEYDHVGCETVPSHVFHLW